MGEARQNDDQQRLSKLQGQQADRGRHACSAHRRFPLTDLRVLVPSRFPVVQGQATNMSAVKSNKLPKGAHPPIFAACPLGVVRDAPADCFQGSLPEQAIDQRRRRRLIEHEPVVPRQSHPESAQIREVSQIVA